VAKRVQSGEACTEWRSVYRVAKRVQSGEACTEWRSVHRVAKRAHSHECECGMRVSVGCVRVHTIRTCSLSLYTLVTAPPLLCTPREHLETRRGTLVEQSQRYILAFVYGTSVCQHVCGSACYICSTLAVSRKLVSPVRTPVVNERKHARVVASGPNARILYRTASTSSASVTSETACGHGVKTSPIIPPVRLTGRATRCRALANDARVRVLQIDVADRTNGATNAMCPYVCTQIIKVSPCTRGARLHREILGIRQVHF
jgi:hypothetical protein